MGKERQCITRAFLIMKRIAKIRESLGLRFCGRRLTEIGSARDGTVDEKNWRAGCDDTH